MSHEVTGEVIVADLFCGASLLKPQLSRSANASVNQSMMSGTEHPKHMSFINIHRSPDAITSVRRFVSDVNHSPLATTGNLTALRQTIFFQDTVGQGVVPVIGVSCLVVSLHRVGVALLVRGLTSAHRLALASLRAIPLIRATFDCAKKFGFTNTTRNFDFEPPARWTAFAPSFLSMVAALQRTIAFGVVFGLERALAMRAGLGCQFHNQSISEVLCG